MLPGKSTLSAPLPRLRTVLTSRFPRLSWNPLWERTISLYQLTVWLTYWGLAQISCVRLDGGEGEICHATGAYTSRDYDAARLRGLARRTKSAAQGRRLLALAEIYDGGSRTKAACVGGVGLQTIRDWVLRFNAHGPEGLADRQAPGHPGKLNTAQREALAAMVESGPMPAIHGVVRWRLKDLAMWVWEEFRVSVSETTLSRILRALGYRKLSARPRHHAQAAGAVDAFKKRSPSAWTRSRATRGSIATG